MRRQVGHQVGGDGDGTDARSPAPMGDAERLVQVEMGHVAAERTGLAQPDQGVEVGAVDIDLPAMVVDDGAQLGDALLVDAVGGRIRDHDGGQLVLVRRGLGPQVLQVHRPVVERSDHDHPHAGHDRATPRWSRARSRG